MLRLTVREPHHFAKVAYGALAARSDLRLLRSVEPAIVILLLCIPVAAAAGPPEASPANKSEVTKVAAGKAISAYDQLILDAHKALAASAAGGTSDDAIAGYRKAIASDPARPEGHLFLAAALYQKGDFSGADEAATTAANRARADKAFTNLQGKALFLTATIKDAQGKLDEGKVAWSAYADFAKANPDQPYPPASGDAPPMLVKVFPASAADRISKIDAYVKMIADYAKVKEKVLARQKELGITTPEPAKAPTTPEPVKK